MKTAGSARSEDLYKRIAIGGFAAVFLGVLYYNLSGTGLLPWESPASAPAVVVVAAPAPPASSVRKPAATSSAGDAAMPPGNAVGGPAAQTLATTSAALDPTLHMDAMLVTESVAYQGTGRNIFSAVSAPPPIVIPKAIAPVRIATVAAPPPVYRDPGPPPPPPIDLRFCGYFVSPASGVKQAVLVHGEDVFLASAGDIVMRRYRVVSIAANSVQVEDMPNNNKQNLPLLAN